MKKNKSIEILLELGVFEKWLINYRNRMRSHSIETIQNNFNTSLNKVGFIGSTLLWSSTIEGASFWKDISDTYNRNIKIS